MTPAERRALDRIRRQAAALSPELVAALLRGFRLVRDRMSAAEVERLIRAGRILEAVDAATPLALIERALIPAEGIVVEGVHRGVRGTVPTLPARAREVVASFGVLDPRILEAVRTLDTTSIRSLAPGIRQAVRETIGAGIEAGINPREIARGLRDIVGLAPHQAEAVRNFRFALDSGDFAKARGYQLRDRRFDALLRRGAPTRAQIDTMVDAYSRRMLAHHAETHARTAAIESQKLGQRLAWSEAQASGALGDAEVIKQWVTTLDGRERPEHNAMDGAEAPLDQPYRNGQMYPGAGEYNCRCTEVYRVRRAPSSLAA